MVLGHNLPLDLSYNDMHRKRNCLSNTICKSLNLTHYLLINKKINYLNIYIRYKPGSKWIAFPVLIKSACSLVFFAVCNNLTDKRHSIPVYIDSDYLYLIGAILFPLLNGYLISLLMMFAPK